MARYDHNFIALDTETGGLCNSKTGKATIDVALTEIALVTIDNEKLEIIGQDSWLIKPYDDNLLYDPRAAAVSGIDKALCEKEGLEIDVVYKAVLKTLKAGKVKSKKPILIMQNKGFDIPFMENLFKLFDDDLWKHISAVEDTLVWARYKYIEKPSFALGSIAEMLNIDLVNGHRALPDTITTAKIWIKFMQLLRGEGAKAVEEVKEVRIRETHDF